MNGKTARLFLPTPAYYHSHLPAIVIRSPRPAWNTNAANVVRRELKYMMVEETLTVNGRTVHRRAATRYSKAYVVDGVGLTLDDAVALLTQTGGEDVRE